MNEPLSERSKLSSSTPTSVTTYGADLVREVMGVLDLGSMVHLALTGRVPDTREARLTNACLVTLVEHGLTPSTIAARLTHFGAPESLQASVAAGLLGLGTTLVGSIGAAATMLQRITHAAEGSRADGGVEEVVRAELNDGGVVPGLGHMLHHPDDPRAVRLFDLAEGEGLHGSHCTAMHEVRAVCERLLERRLPINATGAIAALGMDLGLTPMQCQGMGIIARSVGLVAHIAEEERAPLAPEMWRLISDGPLRKHDK